MLAEMLIRRTDRMREERVSSSRQICIIYESILRYLDFLYTGRFSHPLRRNEDKVKNIFR